MEEEEVGASSIRNGLKIDSSNFLCEGGGGGGAGTLETNRRALKIKV